MGDSIGIKVDIENASQGVDVQRVRACVRQECNLRGTAFGRDRLDVSIHEAEWVIKPGQRSSLDFTLALLPSTAHTLVSRLIDCKYHVFVEAVLSGAFNSNIEAHVPITYVCPP